MVVEACEAVGGCADVGMMLTTLPGKLSISVIAIVAAATIGHYAADTSMNGDELDSLRTEFAQASVNACGTEDDNKRNKRIFHSVHNGISSYTTTFNWMPKGQAVEELKAAKEFGVALYPATVYYVN